MESFDLYTANEYGLPDKIVASASFVFTAPLLVRWRGRFFVFDEENIHHPHFIETTPHELPD